MIRTSESVSLGWKVVVVFALAVLAFSIAPASARSHAEDGDNGYAVTALVSSDGVPGTVVDPDLVNAWGLVAGPTSPWWVADNHADVSTLYNAAGTKLGLTVAVAGGPTGLVFNGGTGFPAGPSNGPARFIFSTEGGMIIGWNPSLGTGSQVKVDSSAANAIYKGLAIANTPTGAQIYATDFWNGHVDVFDGTWAAVTTSGGFVDRKIPVGYAPFGIQAIGDRIFVTFAKQGPTGDELHGPGFGFVDAFDSAGDLLLRVARHGALNAPWGLAMAPPDFRRLRGGLLLGHLRRRQVNASAEEDGQFEHRGRLRHSGERPIVIDWLWALEFWHRAAHN